MVKGKKIVAILAAIVILLQSSAPLVIAEEFVISGNGAGSESEVSTSIQTSTSIEQTNSGTVTNNVDTNANTGGNEIKDSSGESSITTGDISSAVQSQTTLNSSSVENKCCNENSLKLTIENNGTESSNEINIESDSTSQVTINQTATIDNITEGTANTGENKIFNNVGNAQIETGSIKANSVIKTGPVNFEKVSGGQQSQNISARISNNGENSKNIITSLIDDLSQINVNNIANINNKSYWDLNTGNNEINGNVGDAKIKTGGIFFDTLIKNENINGGIVDWNCCKTNDPDDNDPGDPPSKPSDNNGTGGSSGSSSNSFSEILGTGGPAVLGFSNTSAILDNPVIFWLGVLFVVLGVVILSKNLSPANLQINEIAKRKRR